MRWTQLGVGLVLSGCIEPQLQPCGDLLCAPDAVCLPNDTCVSKDLIDACVDKADGDTCATAVFTGTCLGGVCTSPRCGDGIVSGSEQCDGPVDNVDCVTYGFDTGVPTCSDRCGLDVVGSCVRFGWERVLSGTYYNAWAGNGRIAVVGVDAVKLYAGSQLLQERTFEPRGGSIVDGNGSTVVATSDNRLARSVNDGPFLDVAVPPVSPRLNVRVADDESLYIADFGSGRVRVFHSTASGWDSLLDVAGNATWMYWASGALYVAYDNGVVQRYTPGAGWATVFQAPTLVTSLLVRPNGYYVTTSDDHAYVINSTGRTAYGDTSCLGIVATGDTIYADGVASVWRDIDGKTEVFDAPIFGHVVSDGTNLYLWGTGLYRFRGTTYARRTGGNLPAADAKLLASGDPVFALRHDIVETVQGLGWLPRAPGVDPIAVAGHSNDDFFAAATDRIVHVTTSTASAVAIPAGIPAITDIAWHDATSTLYAVGEQGLAMRLTGTTWTMLGGIPSTCDAKRLALHGTDVYASGTCGTEGAIWKLAGTTFSEIHRSSNALVALFADADDNLYAAGPAGGVTRIAGAWTDESHATGVSISATSPNDIWVAGGPDELIHFDGMHWSRVAIVGAAEPRVIATPRAIYIAGASQNVLIR